MDTIKKRLPLFVFPNILNDTGETVRAWDRVTNRKMVILDYRTEAEKKIVRLQLHATTFKAADAQDVFQDRP